MTKREITKLPGGGELREYRNEDGELHCPDGPARIWRYPNGKVESKSWWLNGKLHRTNGHAAVQYDENGQVKDEGWLIEGKEYTLEGYLAAGGTLPEKTTTQGDQMESRMSKEEYLFFVEQTFYDMQELIKKKNTDYTAGGGPFANFEESLSYGVDPLVGLSVRVGDKIQRLKSFCQSGKLEVENEGVEDIFKDLIGYSCIALGMLKERSRG